MIKFIFCHFVLFAAPQVFQGSWNQWVKILKTELFCCAITNQYQLRQEIGGRRLAARSARLVSARSAIFRLTNMPDFTHCFNYFLCLHYQLIHWRFDFTVLFCRLIFDYYLIQVWSTPSLRSSVSCGRFPAKSICQVWRWFRASTAFCTGLTNWRRCKYVLFDLRVRFFFLSDLFFTATRIGGAKLPFGSSLNH